MPTPIEAVTRIIREEDDFLVTSHVNPDGDAVGAMAALGWILAALGKRFTLYNASGEPAQFDWLSLPGPLVDTLPDPLPAWTFALDCGSRDRVGPELAERINPDKAVNIDHHLGNPDWALVNWVDPSQPSTGSMIALLADDLGIPLAGSLAEAVYLAVATDTGFFTYASTTPETLELAADLIRGGLDVSTVNHNITAQLTPHRLRLWTDVLQDVALHHDSAVAVAGVTREMFQRTGTKTSDTEDLINIIRELRGVRAAILLRQEGPGEYKFSLRSFGADNVQRVAASFGGGGHKNAAGGTIEAPDMDTAKATLVHAVAQGLGLR